MRSKQDNCRCCMQAVSLFVTNGTVGQLVCVLSPVNRQGVTSGLNTNSDLCLSYSAHKSFDISHNVSPAQLLQTNTHTHTHTHTHTTTHNISTKSQSPSITVKIFLHTKFTSAHLILYRPHQSLSGSDKLTKLSFEIQYKIIEAFYKTKFSICFDLFYLLSKPCFEKAGSFKRCYGRVVTCLDH